MPRGRDRFTLIEMLVVIAIIAILVALLMPSLQKALATARQTACANSQRQSSVGVMLYADEWNGFFTYKGNIGGDIFWTSYVSGATGGAAYATRNVLYCPANRFYREDIARSGGHFAVGPKLSNGGYGIYFPMEDNLYSTRGFNFAQRVGALPYAQYLFRIPRVSEAGKIGMLADTTTMYAPFGVGHMLAYFVPHKYARWSTAINTLHQDMANITYFDGHVSSHNPLGLFESILQISWYVDEGLVQRTFP